jgi:hypothetical protein
MGRYTADRNARSISDSISGGDLQLAVYQIIARYG